MAYGTVLKEFKRRNKAVQSSEVTGPRWVGLQPGSYPPKSRGRTQDTPPTLLDDVLHVPLMWNYAARRSLLTVFSLIVHMCQPHFVIVAILTTMKSSEWLGLTLKKKFLPLSAMLPTLGSLHF